MHVDRLITFGALAASMVAEATHTNTWPTLDSPEPVYGALDAAPPPSRKPVLYTHLHKSAGTSMCALAELNNESISSGVGLANCNTENDGCNAAHAAVKSCEERLTAAEATGYTYMGIEKWVDDFAPESCPGLLYATVLREPMSRIVSNTEFARSLGWNATNEEIISLLHPGTSADTTVGHAPPVPGNASREMHSGCRFVERSVASFDNFYVRTFGGWGVYSKPAGSLTVEDLEVAKARLAQYDVVITLESFDAQAFQLARVLGWSELELPERNEEKEMARPEAVASEDFSNDQLIQLTTANALDSIFYSYALSIARNRTLSTGARLFPVEEGLPE